jgi:LuxR family maltose regulon positive regulatory protein
MGLDSVTASLIGHTNDVGTPIVASKLTPPAGRPGLVERTALLDRLVSDPTPSVTSIVAPAGYGKSTLLCQLAERDPRPCGWLTLDDEDNDPVVLLSYLAATLDRIVTVGPEPFARLQVPHPSLRIVTSMLGAMIAAHGRPVLLILDDVHVLENHDCQDIIAALIDPLPEGSQLAAASRRELPLPVQRLRAHGRIAEIGPEDLAFDRDEAANVLRAAGIELTASDMGDLLAVTEGWAVPVYLAARSMSARGTRAALDVAKLGQQRDVVAYVQSELLSMMPDETVEFLTRSAVLDQVSGPLCDAVLDTTGSVDRLEALSRSSMLVTPLDEHRRWYRYHHILRDLLRTELERREPASVPELSRRAGHWCDANGLPEMAIGYAMAAGDADRVASIVLRRALPLYRSGRTATLMRWFDWFDTRGLMDRQPVVAVLGALVSALTGHAALAERWIDPAEHHALAGVLSDGRTPVEGLQAIVRAGLCRHGVDTALSDAELGERLVPAGSAWRPLAVLVLGVVQLLTGDTERADQVLSHAVAIAVDDNALPAASVALAERAVLAIERGEHTVARSFADRACEMVERARLDGMATNALVFAVAGRATIHAGDVERATVLMHKAQRLRPSLTYALPHVAVQSRLELIHVMLALADAPGARTVLREVDDIFHVRPDLGRLPAQAQELRTQLDRMPSGAVGASSLTTAELRLLPLLQTHLTFRGIGERLFVSPHTVKTQAISIYRKLGVSSRADAVREASALGLLHG